eukprot:TRINITY_DN7009_c0_g1_i1.p1 TRINITY_DN7009_c0_g1~~TRINITY_DN7009_c0_g1_i1.p1  ORF type:complete len:315 (+),score=-32.80 TRINITY_DN7009_c0_g1_i1:169-1113(+)
MGCERRGRGFNASGQQLRERRRGRRARRGWGRRGGGGGGHRRVFNASGQQLRERRRGRRARRGWGRRGGGGGAAYSTPLGNSYVKGGGAGGRGAGGDGVEAAVAAIAGIWAQNSGRTTSSDANLWSQLASDPQPSLGTAGPPRTVSPGLALSALSGSSIWSSDVRSTDTWGAAATSHASAGTWGQAPGVPLAMLGSQSAVQGSYSAVQTLQSAVQASQSASASASLGNATGPSLSLLASLPSHSSFLMGQLHAGGNAGVGGVPVGGSGGANMHAVSLNGMAPAGNRGRRGAMFPPPGLPVPPAFHQALPVGLQL